MPLIIQVFKLELEANYYNHLNQLDLHFHTMMMKSQVVRVTKFTIIFVDSLI